MAAQSAAAAAAGDRQDDFLRQRSQVEAELKYLRTSVGQLREKRKEADSARARFVQEYWAEKEPLAKLRLNVSWQVGS